MLDFLRKMAKRRTIQGLVAACALIGALSLASSGAAVFRSARVGDDASAWRVVLADRATIGFLRLAAIALALHAIASSAALIAGGRWIRGLSSSGLQMDNVRETDDAVEVLKASLRSTEEERDQAVRVAEEVTRWLNRI